MGDTTPIELFVVFLRLIPRTIMVKGKNVDSSLWPLRAGHGTCVPPPHPHTHTTQKKTFLCHFRKPRFLYYFPVFCVIEFCLQRWDMNSDLELWILLPLSPKFWDNSPVPPCPVCILVGIKSLVALCRLSPLPYTILIPLHPQVYARTAGTYAGQAFRLCAVQCCRSAPPQLCFCCITQIWINYIFTQFKIFRFLLTYVTFRNILVLVWLFLSFLQF